MAGNNRSDINIPNLSSLLLFGYSAGITLIFYSSKRGKTQKSRMKDMGQDPAQPPILTFVEISDSLKDDGQIYRTSKSFRQNISYFYIFAIETNVCLAK